MMTQKLTKLNPIVSETLEDLTKEYQKGIVGGMKELVTKLGPSLYLAQNKRWPEARPIEVIRIDGPTGVGKSLGVKRLFKILGGKPENLLYIDGGSMQSGHEASKMFGAPPGYVGYGDEPLIGKKSLDKSRTANFQNPFILWDEFDKTHMNAKRALLNALEEGWLTLGNGTKLSLEGAFIFMTSNLGSMESQKRAMTFEGGVIGKGAVKHALKEEELPELRNRFTQTLWIEPLTKNECYEIIDLEMLQALKSFKIKCNVRLEESVRDHIISTGYSADFGAREIKRVILRNIIPALISVENSGPNIRISYADGEIQFSLLG